MFATDWDTPRGDRASVDIEGPWVDVVFLDDVDTDAMFDINPDVPSGTTAMDLWAEYMAQWDQGAETDDAHTRTAAPWGADDDLYLITVSGVRYVMAVNHRLGYASLNRRPLDWKA